MYVCVKDSSAEGTCDTLKERCILHDKYQLKLPLRVSFKSREPLEGEKTCTGLSRVVKYDPVFGLVCSHCTQRHNISLCQ